ncbi:MAG TPA: response regulator [Blastocatellia bacterium]|nr:response regulator [Blastocatellia bacterium]
MEERIKGHILCVDDDLDTCEMLTVLLGQAGYEVQYALSVRDGLAKARQGGFELILLDWSFADGTGLELCQQIRAFDARTTVLFYTGEIDEAAVEAALVAGAQGYLIKPVAVERLLQAISEYVEPVG